MIRSLLWLLVLICPCSQVSAQRFQRNDATLQTVQIQVGDLTRQYLVSYPEDKTIPAPVVFGFHGHGGTAKAVARTFNFQKHWPEAIVVYMQGVPTPGQLTDPEGKRNGWQHEAGAEDDRDLKFFDAVFDELKKNWNVDLARIYSTGHSNGGGLTYLLWAERGDIFAAMAPSAATGGRNLKSLKPKPVMHLAGEQDTLVKFRWQELMIQGLKKLNQCEEQGAIWSKYGTLYPSKQGNPVLAYIHPGTHQYPSEAPPLIVKFFQSHRKMK